MAGSIEPHPHPDRGRLCRAETRIFRVLRQTRGLSRGSGTGAGRPRGPIDRLDSSDRCHGGYPGHLYRPGCGRAIRSHWSLEICRLGARAGSALGCAGTDRESDELVPRPGVSAQLAASVPVLRSSGRLVAGGPVGYLLFPELRGRHVERARAMVSQLWVVGTVAVGALSVAFITAITVILAPAAAHGVQDGRSYRDWSVPWRADPVTVVWLQQGAGTDPLGAHCLMYLGQANGIAVLYDVDTHQSVRLASAGVLLLIDSSSDRCRRT